MTWFIFIGDMLVMLFMVVLVVWVFMVSSDEDIDESANIPLCDEVYESDLIAGQVKDKEAGISHG